MPWETNIKHTPGVYNKLTNPSLTFNPLNFLKQGIYLIITKREFSPFKNISPPQKDISLDESALSTTLDESAEQITADEALKADTRRRQIGEELQALTEQLSSSEQYAKSLQANDETFALLRVSDG